MTLVRVASFISPRGSLRLLTCLTYQTLQLEHQSWAPLLWLYRSRKKRFPFAIQRQFDSVTLRVIIGWVTGSSRAEPRKHSGRSRRSTWYEYINSYGTPAVKGPHCGVCGTEACDLVRIIVCCPPTQEYAEESRVQNIKLLGVHAIIIILQYPDKHMRTRHLVASSNARSAICIVSNPMPSFFFEILFLLCHRPRCMTYVNRYE